MKVIETLAPAKVNLALHVTGRKTDGFHVIDSIAMFADSGDRLTISRSSAPRLRIKGPMARDLPSDDRNIVMKAMQMMDFAADIILEKNLPMAAGLGGGSSDAAAALIAMSELAGRQIPSNAASLGADIPVCLLQKTARMRGIGDRIEEIPDMPTLHAVLANPGLEVATGDVYRNLKSPENKSIPDNVPDKFDTLGLAAWLGELRNDLETPAIALEPAIQLVLDALSSSCGCLLSRMSGSGATCFGLYETPILSTSAARRLKADHPDWWVKAVKLNPSSQFS
ncbi:MAG: 4-(cytidine 5'-diphospho)-2-C-methyl-D-erythritol kinase [Roseovarius sp.]|nr:4-(cytidine 5'-diphospho)-2-C-methyl-D-erythritol kinase [Roseovarius sp.]MCY4209056.1 4-(cytidine 5'-diphospho)-2-C-methyl-D-erythritol kinase [Roseovarius sp.]MCY4290613.1 4-(cytidine 5'-diphospho)-2-C-methyl-D-erythritol kinase [Roseovarius sp.]MCY4315667.1 4-(cytidine 5'-diphospho)-2-C-methyl-D-erythritol kinase [Roseovarius sp.]